ncbi:MAG: hypothetical protein U5L09_03515 [Bacteroidales bacterium]|nr:hypothetical protein [Bacteroidales bacterium]
MKKILLIAAALIMLSGCTILEQASQANTLRKCDFTLQKTSHLTIAGVDLEGKKEWSDFSFGEALQLTMALSKEELPASVRVHLQAENPNSSTAGMNKLSWKLLIDNQLMTTGLLQESFSIAPDGGITEIPLDVQFDLRKLFTGDSGKALMNLVSNMTGDSGQRSEVAMKLTPSIRVGDRFISYPGEITVRHSLGK